MEDYFSFEELTAKAKTRTEVAAEYGIDIKTLYARLANEGIFLENGTRLFPKDLITIYNALGIPKVRRKVSKEKSPEES